MTTTQNKTKRAAEIDSCKVAVAEWQRGAITWREMFIRCDLTKRGEKVLAEVSRETPADKVAEIISRAVGTGN